MIEADFALYNVNQLVTVAPEAYPAAQGQLGVIERAALAARDGMVVWIGTMEEMQNEVRMSPDATVVNSHGQVVLPGFVDPFTRPVFAGGPTRDIERTMIATAERSEDALLDLAFARADTLADYGTTTFGAATGYSRNEIEEEKALRALNRLQNLHTQKIIPQTLPPAIIPPRFAGNGEAYIHSIIKDWLPAAHDHAAIVGVPCGQEPFTPATCRRILQRAKEMGFRLAVHGDGSDPVAAVQLAVEMGANSVDGIAGLGDALTLLQGTSTVPVLRPGIIFAAGRGQYPPARRLLDAGIPVALSSDFNPTTSPSLNMQFVLSLAVLHLGLSVEEAIRAATLGGAAALGMAKSVGSLQPGKYCDFVVYDVEDYRDIPVQFAMNLVDTVVACAEVIVRNGANLPAPGVPATP